MPETPQNTPEEPQNSPRVAPLELEPAQQQVQIMRIRLLHRRGGVVCSLHGFCDDLGEQIEIACGNGSGALTALRWRSCVICSAFPGPRMRGTGGTKIDGLWSEPCRQFVQTHGNSLAEIHRGLARIGGNLHEHVAESEIFAGEPALLRPEDQRHAAAAGELGVDKRRQLQKRNHGLLGLAMLERSGANHERAIGHGFGKAFHALRVFEQVRGADGGLRLAPVLLIRSNHGEAPEAKVRHRPRHRSYIEGIARRDENHFEACALFRSEQGVILAF